MTVVDTSAIIAIVTHESEESAFVDILNGSTAVMSMVSFVGSWFGFFVGA